MHRFGICTSTALSRRLSSSSIGASSGVCAWLVAFYLTGIKPDKVDKAGSDMTDPVPELVQLLRATDKAPSDAEMRREAAAELTRLAQEMGLIP
jgi:hypothetical protein